jgi:hypothetical protein
MTCTGVGNAHSKGRRPVSCAWGCRKRATKFLAPNRWIQDDPPSDSRRIRQMALQLFALTLRPALVGCLVAAGMSAGAAMAAPPAAADCDPTAPGARAPAAVRAPVGRPPAAKVTALRPTRTAAKPMAQRSVATPTHGTPTGVAPRVAPRVAPGNTPRATVKPAKRTPVIRVAATPSSAQPRTPPARTAKPARACGPSAADPIRATSAPEAGEAAAASRPTSRASLLRAAAVGDATQDTTEYGVTAAVDPLAGIWTGLPGERGPIAAGQSGGWGALGSGVIEASHNRWTGGGEGGRSGMGGGSPGTGRVAEMTSGKTLPYSPGGGGSGSGSGSGRWWWWWWWRWW